MQAALDAVTASGIAPVDMRYFAARDSQPAEYCRSRVRECAIYVAVIGFRYGSIVLDFLVKTAADSARQADARIRAAQALPPAASVAAAAAMRDVVANPRTEFDDRCRAAGSLAEISPGHPR